jgi:serine/threonine-protein kinase
MIKRIPRQLLVCAAIIFLFVLYPDASFAQSDPTPLQGRLTVLGHGAGSPDDVAIGADDTIYFGDMKSNKVMRLRADGTAEAVSPTIREPEGIVALPDGTLIVVEQATNRLYRVDPVTKTMTLFYGVGNRTSNDGIDGISLDTLTGDLLIPDAPTGRILHISVNTKRVTTILSGFTRPTSAVRSSDGTYYVCDEFGNKIYRVDDKGKRTVIAEMTLPDDVILDNNGHLLVNSLDRVIWQIDLQTGTLMLLVIGLKSPHGIALDSHGNIIIADAGFNEIFRLTLPLPL